VHTQVLGQLGMERGEEKPTVAHENRLTVERADDLDLVAETADTRRANENAAQRALVSMELDIRLEAPDLPPERVAVDDEIGETEVLAVEHDHSRACPEHDARERADRLIEPVERREPHDRRRLPARNHETVETVELLRKADLDDLGAERAQRRRVLAERSLERENPDPDLVCHVDQSRFAGWDSTFYTSGVPHCLRRVDGNLHSPTDLTGDVVATARTLYGNAAATSVGILP